MLAAGGLDFVLHAEHKAYQDGFRLTTLGYAPPVLLARRGHPLEGTPLTWEALQQYPHVRLIIPELEDIQFQGPDPAAWRTHSSSGARGRWCRSCYTDHLYTAIRTVLTSDSLFPAPPLFMEQDELAKDLVALPLTWRRGDLDQVCNGELMNGWMSSPAHQFLRGEILYIIGHFRDKYGLPCLEDLRALKQLTS